jgi:hypothetical protein
VHDLAIIFFYDQVVAGDVNNFSTFTFFVPSPSVILVVVSWANKPPTIAMPIRHRAKIRPRFCFSDEFMTILLLLSFARF